MATTYRLEGCFARINRTVEEIKRVAKQTKGTMTAESDILVPNTEIKRWDVMCKSSRDCEVFGKCKMRDGRQFTRKTVIVVK